MAEILTTEEIFKKLQEEKRTGELMPLPKEFYIEAGAVEKQDGKSEAEKGNTTKLINSLRERRRQKLLVYIAYNKPLPSLVPQEEEDLYREIERIINKGNSHSRNTKIKMNASLPQVITPKGNKLGPYKQNEIIEVSDSSDVEFLINNKLGEIIN